MTAIAAVRGAGGAAKEIGVRWFGFEGDGTGAHYGGVEMEDEEEGQAHRESHFAPSGTRLSSRAGQISSIAESVSA